MKLKDLSEFSQAERIEFNTVEKLIKYNDKEYHLEVISATEPLYNVPDHDFYAQAVIWDYETTPKKIAYHTLFKQRLSPIDILTISTNIIKEPELFIK